MYDLLGIGIGPFNLGLAALLSKCPQTKALFVDQKPVFQWHPGLLLEGTTLQVPFLADLATMADPTNPYTFLNYLQAKNRLYQFYFLENFHIPRTEYDDYCRWAAQQLPSCQFGQEVIQVAWQEGPPAHYLVQLRETTTGKISHTQSKHLVLGIGTAPAVPANLQPALGDNVFHAAHFLQHQEKCRQARSITVIGSGQSAAEVVYSLLQEQRTYNYELTWLTRSDGFFPMEYSKLGLEHFSPDYIDYFYALPPAVRLQRYPQQDLLYKGIGAKTSAAIYDLLYERTIGGAPSPVNMLAQIALNSITPVATASGTSYLLQGQHTEQQQPFSHESDIVILATGYQYAIPDWLAPLQERIAWDEQGRYQVERDYRLRLNRDLPNHIYVQNAEMHTHGVGTPDLGLGAYRNSVIINSLTGENVYPVQHKTIFQNFGLPKGADPHANHDRQPTAAVSPHLN